eukprot:SAG11_NODE_4194_length_2021_cov_1.290843_2_plen_120_part_01
MHFELCASNCAKTAAVAESNAPIKPNEVGHFGSGVIDYQSPSDQYITFDVVVPSDGDYLMQVSYALASNDRPLQLSVNGAAIDVTQQDGYDADGLIHFPRSSSWTDYLVTDATPVTLTAG